MSSAKWHSFYLGLNVLNTMDCTVLGETKTQLSWDLYEAAYDICWHNYSRHKYGNIWQNVGTSHLIIMMIRVKAYTFDHLKLNESPLYIKPCILQIAYQPSAKLKVYKHIYSNNLFVILYSCWYRMKHIRYSCIYGCYIFFISTAYAGLISTYYTHVLHVFTIGWVKKYPWRLLVTPGTYLKSARCHGSMVECISYTTQDLQYVRISMVRI